MTTPKTAAERKADQRKREAERLAALQAYEAALDGIAAGTPPAEPMFQRLAAVLANASGDTRRGGARAGRSAERVALSP